MTGMGLALCAAIGIDGSGEAAPDWLHLLPAGEARTHDGRGPYRIGDAAALMSASLGAGQKLVLDENHSTDLAAPKGGAAPAHGWIVDLQSRADGIWGRVEWVDPAAQMWRRYRGVSPVIAHRRDGHVTAILRASLTNTPNLAGLVALHSQENDMGLRETLIGALGLASDADDAAIVAAAGKKEGDATVALQAALKPIALAAGLAEGADAAAVLAGVEQLKAGGDKTVTALQSELATVTTRLNTLTEQGARDKATAFVDAGIAAGRVGLKPVRDRYIALHMRDAAEAEAMIGAMPILAPGATTVTAVTPPEGAPANPALLAQKAGAYQKKMADAGVAIDFGQAVRAVEEGKDA